MPRLDLDDVGLHYEIDGDGPACLVLHGGLGHDHVLYRRTLAPLAEDFRLIYLDHRGNGRSVPADLDTITMEQLADDAVALVDGLGIDRFVVLGHSYGGFVAQELALRHPGRVDGLILVDTTPGQLGSTESPDDEQGPPPPPEMLEAMSVLPASDEEYGARVESLLPFYLHRRDPSDVVPLMEGSVHRLGPMLRGFMVLSSWSSVDRLHEITAPTLLIVGRYDYFTSFPQSYRIARRIPGAEVVVLEESGHFSWLDEPEAFFAAVRAWSARALPG
jgi:proline iminopeptidase